MTNLHYAVLLVNVILQQIVTKNEKKTGDRPIAEWTLLFILVCLHLQHTNGVYQLTVRRMPIDVHSKGRHCRVRTRADLASREGLMADLASREGPMADLRYRARSSTEGARFDALRGLSYGERVFSSQQEEESGERCTLSTQILNFRSRNGVFWWILR